MNLDLLMSWGAANNNESKGLDQRKCVPKMIKYVIKIIFRQLWQKVHHVSFKYDINIFLYV